MPMLCRPIPQPRLSHLDPTHCAGEGEGKKGPVLWRAMSSFLTRVHTQGQKLAALSGKHLCLSRLTVCKDLGPYSLSLQTMPHCTAKISTARGVLQFGETQRLFCLHRVNSICAVQGLVIELSFFFLLPMLCCISHVLLLLNLKA